MSYVHAYLCSQNRPYSIIQLFDNLHGRVNKALLEGALGELVSRGVVCVKEYGKAKVYWPSQSGFADVTAEQVAAVNASKEELEARLAEVSAERKAVDARVSALTSGPSGAALEAALEAERQAVAALEARIAGIRGAAPGGGSGGSSSSSSSAAAAAAAPRAPLSAKEKAAVKASISRYRKVWATRKAACVDFVQSMADSGGGKASKIFEEVGIETDESVGVNIKDFPA